MVEKVKSYEEQLSCTWIAVNNEVHMFVVDNQDLPVMLEICAELKRLSGLVHDAVYVSYTEFVLHRIYWKKKKRHFICVTIVRSWLLRWESSTQLTVLQSE
jgi:hypothetical protein